MNIGSMMIQNTNIDYTNACIALQTQNEKLRTEIRSAQQTRGSYINQPPASVQTLNPRQAELLGQLEKLKHENSYMRVQLGY